MNILYMAKETVSSILSLKYIISHGGNVVFTVVSHNAAELQRICEEHRIPYGSEDDLRTEMTTFPRIEYLFSYYWKLVKKDILDIPIKGSINFHPEPLPEARGSGYHTAILNDWGYWGATAHYMSEEFDTGDIIRCRRFDIPSDIVNKDLVHLTHMKLYDLFCEIYDDLDNEKKFHSEKQGEGHYFSLKEVEAEKYISPSDDDQMIERFVRTGIHPIRAQRL